MISKDTIALVRDRTDIVAVVSEVVPSLKKRGRSFVGLCPFHSEKTPSFSVNPDGFFHCFGCKESGDVFAFLEKADGYTFAEAVRALAERAGVPIADERQVSDSDEQRRKKERAELYSVMQMAAVFYQEQLRDHPDASYARDELARRQIDPSHEAAQAFCLGYAPPGWDALANFLKRQGVSPAVGELVGLLVPRSSGPGYYDRFRHRLMFAVMDVQGRVVAFSGRTLAPRPGDDATRDPPPKYINSPESPIYVKGANLFGLWQARHVIRQKERAIVVEGNFDVVGLHARGLQNTVAPLGTAFTVDQAKLLHRYASDVVLLFDGDAAGRKAARAAEEPCEKAGLRAQVGILPDRTDPDEFVRTKGEPALRHLLGQARGLVDYLIDMELDESFHAADARERAERIERVTAILGRQRDPVTREMLKEVADRAASRLDLVRSAPNAYQALVRKVMASARMAEGPAGPRPREARVRPRPPGQEERKAIVGALLDFPALADDADVREALTLLSGESARIVAALRACTRTKPGGEKALDGAEFLAQMPPVIQAFASARLAAPAHENLEEARATVIANAKKLRETNVALEAREVVLEQRRNAGNWDAELESLKHVEALVRQRQGMDPK